jgi:hypothetical protein
VAPTPKGVALPAPKEVIVSVPRVISSLYIRYILTLSKIL